MNADPERASQSYGGMPEPVGPSLMARIVLRPMTRILNPLILKLAGRRHFRMAALIRHTGRRSGRAYTTPVSGRRSGDIVLLTLTFGNQSDWVRNVRAARGCSIRIDGQDYDLAGPRFLTRQEARPQVADAFGPMERAGFRMLGIRQVMRLDIVPAKS